MYDSTDFCVLVNALLILLRTIIIERSRCSTLCSSHRSDFFFVVVVSLIIKLKTICYILILALILAFSFPGNWDFCEYLSKRSFCWIVIFLSFLQGAKYTVKIFMSIHGHSMYRYKELQGHALLMLWAVCGIFLFAISISTTVHSSDASLYCLEMWGKECISFPNIVFCNIQKLKSKVFLHRRPDFMLKFMVQKKLPCQADMIMSHMFQA